MTDTKPPTIGYYTIPVRDLERGRVFYGGLFAWKFDEQGPDYSHIAESDVPAGGLHKHDDTSTKVWFRIDDIATAVARVRELGGHADEPSESASGWNADCRDDQGTSFSLWQPAPGL